MRQLFAFSTIALVLLSIGVWRLQPTPPADGRAVLTWVSDPNPLRRGQYELFNKSNDRYRVQLDPDNLGVELSIVQSLAGVGPDLIDCWDAFQLAAYVKSGVVLDVTDTLAAAGIDVKSQCFPGILGAAISQGRVYGVPADMAVDGIWFHRELFRQAGLPYPKGPWTWEELAQVAQKLTLKDSKGRITRYGLLLDWNWTDFLDYYGARVFSPDGTKCVVDSPEAIRAISMMRDLVYKYHVAPTPAEQTAMATAGGWGSGSISWFGAKRGAMALGGRWWLAMMRNYKGLDLGVAEAPNIGACRYSGYGRVTLVNKNSKHLRGALEFLKYLASPAYNRLINSQADAVCAFKEFARDPMLLHDPMHPNEHDNDVWITATEHGIADGTTPFLDGATVRRIIDKQLELVQDDQKTAGQALHDARTNIESAMRDALAENPEATAKFRALTGRDAP